MVGQRTRFVDTAVSLCAWVEPLAVGWLPSETNAFRVLSCKNHRRLSEELRIAMRNEQPTSDCDPDLVNSGVVADDAMWR